MSTPQTATRPTIGRPNLDPSRLLLLRDHLAIDTGRCTCGAGTPGPHRYGCGAVRLVTRAELAQLVVGRDINPSRLLFRGDHLGFDVGCCTCRPRRGPIHERVCGIETLMSRDQLAALLVDHLARSGR